MKTYFKIIALGLIATFSACQDDADAPKHTTDTDTVIKHNEVTVVKDTEAEWIAYKQETEARIKSNEDRILVLEDKKANPGVKMDEHYNERIKALKQKNEDLKNRIGNYDKNRSNWEEFKREFNHDMEELGESLKNFGQDNTK